MTTNCGVTYGWTQRITGRTRDDTIPHVGHAYRCQFHGPKPHAAVLAGRNALPGCTVTPVVAEPSSSPHRYVWLATPGWFVYCYALQHGCCTGSRLPRCLTPPTTFTDAYADTAFTGSGGSRLRMVCITGDTGGLDTPRATCPGWFPALHATPVQFYATRRCRGLVERYLYSDGTTMAVTGPSIAVPPFICLPRKPRIPPFHLRSPPDAYG